MILLLGVESSTAFPSGGFYWGLVFFFLSTFGLQLKVIKMRTSVFIGNPKVLKKDKYLTLEEKNPMFLNVSQWQKKKCFANNQNVLFMNEIELESPLSMASMWLLRSSEKRDQL